MKRILGAMLLLAAQSAWAGEPPVTVVPMVKVTVAIENKDVGAAQRRARDEAMREACIQAAGATIDSATMVEGSTQGLDKILSTANGYVKSMEIDQEDSGDKGDGTYVLVARKIVVGTGDLSKDVAAVKSKIAAMEHPRLYTLVREQILQDHTAPGAKDKPVTLTTSQGLVEQGITEHMRALGWRFVDPQVASGKVHVDNALTTDLANLNGKDFSTVGAEYVVLGSVVITPVEEGVLKGANLRTVLNVKSTDTGETVASVQKTEQVPGASIDLAINKAVAKASDELGEALSKQVLEDWRKRTMGTGQVSVTVLVADYDALSAFEDALRGAANIKSVKENSWKEGKADLTVSLNGSDTKLLASSISKANIKSTGYKATITGRSANTLEVKLSK